MAITFDSKTSKNPTSIKHKQEDSISTKPTYGVDNKKQQDIYFGNNSFSGTDMVAVMSISNVEGVTGTYVLGSLQTLTYSTHMQRSPIRSIGNVNAKDYVMGPRTIAGSLVFAVFDRHFAYAAMEDIKGTNDGFHFLADELPPFDITITMANEYGKKAKLVIYGVRLVNEGQVMSVNDIFTENTYQFVAHDLDYLSDQTTSVGGSFVHEDLKHRPGYITDAIEVTEEDIDTSIEEDLNTTKHITLDVKTTPAQETPDVLYNGKASITLDRKVKDGLIRVITEQDEQIEAEIALTTDTQWPYVCNLPKGNYIAYYEDTTGERSKYNAFYISQVTYEKIKLAPPIQIFEDRGSDNKMTIAVKIIDTVGKGIRYAKKPLNASIEPAWKAANVQNKVAMISGLEDASTYLFQATDINLHSSTLEIYLDGVLNAIFSDFYTHIIYNAHKIDAFIFKSFNKIWLETLAIKDQYKVYSVAGAIEQAKLNHAINTDKVHYTYYINEAIKFEKTIADFKNIALTLKTPVIIDIPNSLIEFNKNVKRLKISSETKAPKLIESHSFIQKGEVCQYRLHGEPGKYTVVAITADGLYESGPLEVIVFSQKDKEDLIAGKVTTEELSEAQKSELVESDGKWLNNQLSESEKDNINEEMLQDSKLINEGIPQPVIAEMTDKYLKVRTQIPSTAYKKYFLCVCDSKDISKTELHKKIPISEKSDTISLYVSKYGFIAGKRYSLWIENDVKFTVSNTTSFCFNQKDNPQSTAKDVYMADKIKKLMGLDYNKNQVDSYMEDGFNPVVALDSILKANCQLPNSFADKADVILDITRARHKYLYGADDKLFYITHKGTVRIDMRQGLIGGYNQHTPLSELQFDWFGEHGGDLCNQSEVYSFKPPYIMFENRYIPDDTLALVVYFKNKESNKVTEPIVIDFVSNSTYSRLKTEVIYP